MNAVGQVFDLPPMSNLAVSIVKIGLHGLEDVCFLQSWPEALRQAVVRRLPGSRPANGDTSLVQDFGRQASGIVAAWIGMASRIRGGGYGVKAFCKAVMVRLCAKVRLRCQARMPRV